MVPFFVLLASFVFFWGVGWWVPWLAPWPVALRWALASMFMVTATAHWGSRRADLVQMVPDALPAPEVLVTLTGVLEIVGAIALLVPATAPAAGAGLAVLLIAMFPANVYAALNELTLSGAPVTPLLPRTLLQLVFIAACAAASLGLRA